MLILYILNFFSNISKKNDTFGSIAHSITHHLSSMNNFSIESLAKLCSVSQSSVSRFAKMMDYDNYHSFADSIKEANYQRRFGENNLTNENDASYFELQYALLKNCEEIFNELNLEALKKDILSSSKVVIVGSPKPDATTLLQMELNMQQIECTNYYSPDDQYFDLDEANKESFVIIYDCYPIDSILPYLINLNKQQRCLLITYNRTNFDTKIKYSLRFENQNFAMNMQTASILTYALLSVIQQHKSN